MIEHLENKDVVTINLEEVFGRVVMLSAYQAERSFKEDDPLLLVMNQTDIPVFLAHLDPVKGSLFPPLALRIHEDGIQISEDTFTVNLQKGVMTLEGLMSLEKYIGEALVYGVLSNFQAGARGYEAIQYNNANSFSEAIKAIENVLTYRVRPVNKIRITQREL